MNINYRKNIFIFCMMSILALFVISFPIHLKATPVMVDSFEGKIEWKPDSSGDWPTVTLATQYATDQKHSLEITFKNTGKGKAIISHLDTRDLSSINALVLDATNPQSSPINLAIALQTGSSWTWFETKPVSLKPGLNKGVKFDLTNKDFKSEATQWEYTTSFKSPGNINRFNCCN